MAMLHAVLAAAALTHYNYPPLAVLERPLQGTAAAVQDGLGVVTTPAGLALVDLNVPADPQYLGTAPLPPGTTGHHVALSDGCAFIAAGPAGIHVVNVTNPDTPTLTATFTNFTDDDGRPVSFAPTHIVVHDAVLYATDAVGTGVVIVDASEPQMMLGTDFLDLAGAGHLSVTASGLFLIVAIAASGGGSGGMSIVSVARGSRPYLVGEARDGPLGDITACEVYGDVVAVGSSEGLVLYDIASLQAPAGVVEVTGDVRAATLSGRFLFALGAGRGFDAFDLLNFQTATTAIGSSDAVNATVGPPRAIAVDGTAAYVVYANGLAVYDVTMIATTGRTIAIIVALVAGALLVIGCGVYCYKHCTKPPQREQYEVIK